MPARDTYHVEMKVSGEYDEWWTWEQERTEFLSPDQNREHAMANILRGVAFELAPEEGDQRSDVAILMVLDACRAEILRKNGGFPATRQLLLDQLWSVARGLGLEWYGAR